MYGTLLYRPNTDLIPIVQQSLWKLGQHELKCNTSQPTQPKQVTPNVLGTDQVLDDLNVKIQEQCQSYLTKIMVLSMSTVLLMLTNKLTI